MYECVCVCLCVCVCERERERENVCMRVNVHVFMCGWVREWVGGWVGVIKCVYPYVFVRTTGSDKMGAINNLLLLFQPIHLVMLPFTQ